jgi:undecaprenyl-diphosphatase
VAPGETAVFRLVNDLPGSATDAVEVLLTLGTLTGVVIVAAAAAVASMRVGPPVAVLVAGILARLVTPVVKDLVDRARPAALLGDVHVREHPGGLGYPSSHTAIAVALAVVVAGCFPRARWPAFLVAALVALARMYMGVHLPLDLVGGAALGVLAATPVLLALRWSSSSVSA